mmetsp:Transcript_35672/g.100287  ORF Transcript_35672/g.100287 Transcript_35672/m.100287 type:complete len:213 (-) Transcript_35672:862-1500(-)
MPPGTGRRRSWMPGPRAARSSRCLWPAPTLRQPLAAASSRRRSWRGRSRSCGLASPTTTGAAPRRRSWSATPPATSPPSCARWGRRAAASASRWPCTGTRSGTASCSASPRSSAASPRCTAGRPWSSSPRWWSPWVHDCISITRKWGSSSQRACVMQTLEYESPPWPQSALSRPPGASGRTTSNTGNAPWTLCSRWRTRRLPKPAPTMARGC